MKQNFFIFIPYVNRGDLLLKAIRSLKGAFSEIIIVDNSGDSVDETAKLLLNINVNVFRPTVPLTFAQTQNFMRDYALKGGYDWYAFMHNDAEAGEGTAEKLIETANKMDWNAPIGQISDWGVVFTHYDTLCAYSTKMARVVGPWDTNLPWYFADNDYYKRITLSGFKRIETGLPVEHHGASNTIKADAKLSTMNAATFDLHAMYYKRKWGALDTEEGATQYEAPFNRPDLFKIEKLNNE